MFTEGSGRENPARRVAGIEVERRVVGGAQGGVEGVRLLAFGPHDSSPGSATKQDQELGRPKVPRRRAIAAAHRTHRHCAPEQFPALQGLDWGQRAW